MSSIPESELILNEDASVYHLHLLPGDVAEKIVTVGDQNRVDMVTKYFDRILLEKQSREFRTVTGEIGNTTISVISTGIGTDNIDIVLNELDALFNIDLDSRSIKDQLTSIKVMRLGTSGSIQSAIPIDSIVVSEHASGIEGLMNLYKYTENVTEGKLSRAIEEILPDGTNSVTTSCNKNLIAKFSDDFRPVNTVTATGFYAPQGRQIRLKPKVDGLIAKLSNIEIDNNMLHNIEMETAGIYGLSKLLGHEAISISAILANRIDKTFSSQPKSIVDKMIKVALERLVSY